MVTCVSQVCRQMWRCSKLQWSVTKRSWWRRRGRLSGRCSLPARRSSAKQQLCTRKSEIIWLISVMQTTPRSVITVECRSRHSLLLMFLSVLFHRFFLSVRLELENRLAAIEQQRALQDATDHANKEEWEERLRSAQQGEETARRELHNLRYWTRSDAKPAQLHQRELMLLSKV